jgi:NAD(P)-dependent dehydrogenase (short-subunit alcohol dehydrogenase family)
MHTTRVRTDGGTETNGFPAEWATDLDGWVALVSGGTDGIGKATATRLAESGATVVVVGSTRERGERAVAEISRDGDADAVEFLQADLSRMAEVRALVERFRDRYDRLDALVHTAGVVPSEQVVTEEGVERSFAINYLSRFLSTTLLADLLRASAPARVVNVAAAGANSLERLDLEDLAGDRLFTDPDASAGERLVKGQGALDQAQVANDLFGVELAERLAGTGVGVTVVNPGAVDTDIRLKADEGWREVDEMIRSEMGVVSPATVAETVVPLATARDPEAITGRFFGTGREVIERQDGVGDRALRRRLWDRSVTLSGLSEDRLHESGVADPST